MPLSAQGRAQLGSKGGAMDRSLDHGVKHIEIKMIHDSWTMNLFHLGIQIIARIYNEYAAFSYDMEH